MTIIDREKLTRAIQMYLDFSRDTLHDPVEKERRTADVHSLSEEKLLVFMLQHAVGKIATGHEPYEVLGTIMQMGFYYGRSYEQLEQEDQRKAENGARVPEQEQPDRIAG